MRPPRPLPMMAILGMGLVELEAMVLSDGEVASGMDMGRVSKKRRYFCREGSVAKVDLEWMGGNSLWNALFRGDEDLEIGIVLGRGCILCSV